MPVEPGERPPRRPTLVDVAAKAGVSRALASIIINGAPGASDATRERVLKVAAELNYRPDVRARLLASVRPNLVGAVFGLLGTFHLRMLDGLYLAADERSYSLILTAQTAGRDERRVVEAFMDFRFEALILLGPETPMPVLAGKVPLVVVGWHVEHPMVDVVRTSDDEGMRQAVGHLVELGHRDILHIDGGDAPSSIARRQGYLAAMAAHGLGGQARILPGGLTQRAGGESALLLMREPTLPTAVIAANDDAAAAVLETLLRSNITVPQQISVVGWDDSVIAALPHIQLTSVGQDAESMARAAMDRAIARIEWREVTLERVIVLPPYLAVRATTAPPRVRR